MFDWLKRLWWPEIAMGGLITLIVIGGLIDVACALMEAQS